MPRAWLSLTHSSLLIFFIQVRTSAQFFAPAKAGAAISTVSCGIKISASKLTYSGLRQLSPGELAHQESLIQEREDEIREIESGIHELSEIFRDLGTLVTEQGGMLGTLLHATAFHMKMALTELS